MAGMLTWVASLTICMAMTSAFVLPVPMVSLPDSAWRKQASATLGVPLGGDGRWVGAGGALSQRGGTDVTQAKKKSLPQVPSAEGYIALHSRSTCPLLAFKRAETDLIQDGNATVPIGEMGDEGGEDSAAAVLQDDVEDESAVRHRVSVTMQELSAHFNFWGTRTRITGDALSIYESAWSTQGEDYDIFRDISADGYIAGDDLGSRDAFSDGTAFDAESLPDPADDGSMDEMGLTIPQVAFDDGMRSILHDIEGNSVNEESLGDLAAYNLIDELSRRPFGHVMTEHAAGDDMASVLQDDVLDREASKAAILENRLNAMVWSVIEDAITGGKEYEHLILDVGAKEDLLLAMMHDALFGRAVFEFVNRHGTLEDMVASMLDHAFAGPAVTEFLRSAREKASVEADTRRSANAPTPGMANDFHDNGSLREVHDNSPSSAEGGAHQAGDSSPDGEAPVVRKGRKGAWKWLRKIWKGVRRKGR